MDIMVIMDMEVDINTTSTSPAVSSSMEGGQSSKNSRADLTTSSDSVFLDDEYATVLYEAVKEIGNPEAVGNHYSMTWNDIVQAGFRASKDFKDRGIANLEQLQHYIQGAKTSSSSTSATAKQI